MRLRFEQRLPGRATVASAASAGGGSGGSPPRGLSRVPLPHNFKERVAQQFEERAARYDRGNTYHPPLAARLVQLAALQPGEAVLDVGAGTGLVALQAAQEIGPTGRVLAVDLSTSMLEQAKAKAGAQGLVSVETLAADIDTCTFLPGSIHAILCSSALPFLPDIPASLARWRGWLERSSGRLVFNVPKGIGSRAFTLFAEVAAQEAGLLLVDPSSQFAQDAAVHEMLATAGYSRCELQVSNELNRRAAQTPEQWAAAAWQFCASSPFADVGRQVSAAQLERMRVQYLREAAELAVRYATSAGGIEEPYQMLWVMARP